MFWPCETRTSTCRSFATISSGLYRFLAIAVLLDVKDIPQVGPLQWGWIIATPRDEWALVTTYEGQPGLRLLEHRNAYEISRRRPRRRQGNPRARPRYLCLQHARA